MPKGISTSDKIGSLSVDIAADLTQFDAALTQVEEKLGKANKDVHIRIGITDAQLARLQKAADLIAKIQKTGVATELLSSTAAPRGRGTAAPAQGGNVALSVNEEELGRALRTAATAAFAQPFENVKLNLDLAHVRQQLEGLPVHLGQATVGGTTQAGPAGAGTIPLQFRQVVQQSSREVRTSINDLFTSLRKAMRGMGEEVGNFNDTAEQAHFIFSKLGDNINDIVQVGGFENTEIIGGTIKRYLKAGGDELEQHARNFQRFVPETAIATTYRDYAPAPVAPAQQAPSAASVAQAGLTPVQERMVEQHAQQVAKEASAEAAARAAAAVSTPRTVEEIAAMARERSGYGGRKPGVALTTPWRDPEREWVAGRRAFGAQGLSSFGPLGVEGHEITDLLMAAGPGARMFEGWAELVKGRERTNQFVPMQPDDRGVFPLKPGQVDVVGGQQMRGVSGRDLLQRMLLNQGIPEDEARQITKWSSRVMQARELGADVGGSSGTSLAAMASQGGRGLAEPLVGSGVSRRLAGYNRQRIDEEAIDPYSKFRTRLEDRSSIVRALTQPQNFPAQELYDQLIGGALPTARAEDEEINRLRRERGEEPQKSDRMFSSRAALREAIQPALEQIYDEYGLEGKARSLPALEAAGGVLPSAAVRALYNEQRTRQEMAQPGRWEEGLSATGAPVQFRREGTIIPQRTGMIEARMSGGRHVGDIGYQASGRYQRLQTEYDQARQRFENVFGREGSATHDTLAADLPSGRRGVEPLHGPAAITGRPLAELPDFEGAARAQRGAVREGRLEGEHPSRLQPIIGELDKLETRAKERAARKMGVALDIEGAPIEPKTGFRGGRNFLKVFKETTEAELSADPRMREITGGRPLEEFRATEQERINRMRRILERHEPDAYYRTGAPAVPSGDQLRRRGYELSGMAPTGGVPVTEQEIKRGKIGPPSPGMPALSIASGGPPGTTPPAPPSGRGEGGMRPMGGGTVPVYIMGPFPLTVALVGGGAATARAFSSAGAADMAETPVASGGGAARTSKAKTPKVKAVKPDRFVSGASLGSVVNSLILAGADRTQVEGILAATEAPIDAPDAREPAPEVLRSRAMIREAQARLPSRALSTTAIQLSQRFLGGRGSVEERMIELGRESGRLEPLIARRERINIERQETTALRDRLVQLAGLGKTTPQLTAALGAAQRRVDETANAYEENEQTINTVNTNLERMGKNLINTGDVVKNLGAGFVGGIAGGLVTQAVSVAITAIEAIGSVYKKIFDPAIEAAIGYQNVTNQVIGSLSDQVLANKGLASQTVALAAAQGGLSYSTYQAIAPTLEQAASIEAGNKAYSGYIGMIRSAERVESENMGPRGLYQTTGGFNLLGAQTPFFGTPSTLENFLNQFTGSAYSTQGGAIPDVAFSADAITNIGQYLSKIGDLPDLFGAIFQGGDALKEQAEKFAGVDIKTDRLNQINSQLDKIGSQFNFTSGAVTESTQGIADALRQRGVDEGKIQQVVGLGLSITDASGNLVTDIQLIDQALQDWTRSLTTMDPRTYLASITGPSGALTTQLYQQDQMAQLGRRTNYANFALQQQIAPPIPYGGLLTPGIAGMPDSYRQAYQQGQGSADAAQSFLDQFKQAGQFYLDQQISRIPSGYTPEGVYMPAAQQQTQARNWLGTATQAGTEINRLQQLGGQIQLGAEVRNYNQQLHLTTRAMQDVLGLAGKTNMVMADGSRIQASEVGQLERANMYQSRNLQLLGFERQERQLNYRVALAGFVAEGATGEERAANIQMAKEFAELDRKQLKGQESIADNQWTIQQEQVNRSLEDTVFTWDNLVKSMQETGQLRAIDEQIQKWNQVREFAAAQLATYLDQSHQFEASTIQVATELRALGVSVTEAMSMATQGMLDASSALRADVQTWNNISVGQPSQSNTSSVGNTLPLRTQIDLTPRRSLRTEEERQIVINNPQAGVDTQSLTRAVITELNRQAALRSLIL